MDWRGADASPDVDSASASLGSDDRASLQAWNAGAWRGTFVVVGICRGYREVVRVSLASVWTPSSSVIGAGR
jgi:hypothetical protein